MNPTDSAHLGYGLGDVAIAFNLNKQLCPGEEFRSIVQPCITFLLDLLRSSDRVSSLYPYLSNSSYDSSFLTINLYVIFGYHQLPQILFSSFNQFSFSCDTVNLWPEIVAKQHITYLTDFNTLFPDLQPTPWLSDQLLGRRLLKNGRSSSSVTRATDMTNSRYNWTIKHNSAWLMSLNRIWSYLTA